MGAILNQRSNQAQERLMLRISRPSTEECADVDIGRLTA
jgi:hypothetical protein